MTTDPFTLPPNLPAPGDDGGATHLVGRRMPPVRLPSAQGGNVDLAALPRGWDAIPGARGCTPQNCAFRDLYADFLALGAAILTVSTQSSPDQREMAERLHVPYPLVSDAESRLTSALDLPTFEADGLRFLRRLTPIVRDGTIEHVFYPVFPPNESAGQTLRWLKTNKGSLNVDRFGALDGRRKKPMI